LIAAIKLAERREICSTSVGLRAAHGLSQFLHPTSTAIKLRFLGTVTSTPRNLTYTRSGVPRLTFGVKVGTLRWKHYLITAYGTMARFCDIYLRTDQRISVEGAYLRRYPAFDGLVRADTIRHIGNPCRPFPGRSCASFPRGRRFRRTRMPFVQSRRKPPATTVPRAKRQQSMMRLPPP
jgi:hypothetical protein